jgi:glutamate dehydrogenase
MSSVDPGSAHPPKTEIKINGDGASTPKLFVDGGSGPGTPIGFQRYPHNKHFDHVIRSPVRMPSPQPTHLSIPGTHHRVLSEEDPGYVAAKFEGKQKQMEQGEH